jgi:prepilin-type N-terminal cleavage/methylation domain-containing protein
MTRGFTLLEVIVTVAVLGLLVAVAGLAIRSFEPPAGQEVIRELANARVEAIRSGQPVEWRGDSATLRFFPNGSSSGGRIISGGHALQVDPLTGEVRETR